MISSPPSSSLRRSPVSEEYPLQTTIGEQTAAMLKAHAAIRRVRLLDVYAEAIHHLLLERIALLKKNGEVQYLLAPRKERALTVRVPPKLAQKVLAVVEEDEVPVRAFTYTALFFYAVAERLIPPIQVVQSPVVADDDEGREVHKWVFETGPRARTRKA
jgi:hypothetical protein